MERGDPDGAHKLLAGLLPEPLLEAYVRLVAEDGCSQAEAARLLGSEEKVQALIDRGMAHWGPNPPHLFPASPDLALEGVLADAQKRLTEACDVLLTGHHRLGQIEHAGSELGDVTRCFVEVVHDPEEIKRLSFALINAARDDWMTLENTLQDVPMGEESCLSPPPAFAGTVKCRSIYDASFLKYPVGAKIIDAAVAAGEQARIMQRVGMKMKLADETIAMLPLNPTGMRGALIVRSPVIVGALREYFELLWLRATPVGVVEPDGTEGPSEVQRRILQLMLAGHKDATIAPQVGLSVDSVRRKVDDMKEMLNVNCRFALAAAAQRNGWIL